MAYRICDVCGLTLAAGQRGRHLTCCAAEGGRDPICNPTHKPHVDDDGEKYIRCAACWRRGAWVKTTRRRAA